ncbi:GNAT family N-acetyltransferase [Paenibacillus timonensis]|uniref:GNAT family N-acetyltransferase n=1 Tax=Paenibacillus timonensis TaxID=225915 RepID=A0ABW3SAV7_9BACL|nr:MULTISPECIES: GNAT family protein [Paenibacillus]MCH1639927.1 GNAT family N-acetyltransferase [Paenibacillus timonensis]MDU2242743.1 GNAT family protein [Paenibacillus sp.]
MSHLIGDKIVLREYRDSDLDFIQRWVNDPEITSTLSDNFLYPHSRVETEAFFRAMVEGKSSNKSFVIGARDSLEYIGQIDLYKIDWKNRFASLAVVIGRKECLGKGYGTEAIRLLLKFAFEELNLNRIDLEVYEYNERAYHCYLKCGFKEEGRLRQKVFRVGRYWDSIIMSILRSEYEQL